MNIDLGALRLLESEQGIPAGRLVGILEQAILAAYHQHVGHDSPARVEIDRKSGLMRVLEPEVDDEGNTTGEVDVTPTDFGRVAAAAARQEITRQLRQLADDRLLGEFRDREGTIAAGVVQQSENPRMVRIDLGSTEGVLPPEEQTPGEHYRHGDRLRIYITQVARTPKGATITVSRTHPGLVRGLFALEVPEIQSGAVRITEIAREAGHRTKIAVEAREPGVNAKGACIGELGARVRAVTAELGDEKIDIVDHSDDLATFVANALSPARVTRAEVLDPELRAVRAFVPEGQLSLAIGKEGQNARLAAKLTGARIDIQPDR
ncbi:transcription termination factor NusA [Pseudoclavibacter caeni]|jgi:transcription termination/antitermination protein NusA|uniref:Transcription termination/antitermination protein NusA n=1 Tax=Pseudoclavibacter caeni TaxID=908846 RepID=A0A7C8FTY1_9MICO|nr:transcription termination factor NusA [Pseudoclavibacter caeni]KAB1632410.1 transcription termination/antitermination protein NusA [Pseudoclavibacter caeni]NYJ97660.1 N utilization substance protein A [Pseudoclavibacter caeni]